MPPQRLGPHIILANEVNFFWAQQAPIVKVFDGAQRTTQPLEAAPESAIRIFRHYFSNQDVNRSGHDVANEVLAALGPYRHPNLYVEGLNEVNVENNPDRFIRYVDQMAEFAETCHAAGVKVALGSFSTGTPQGGFVPGYGGFDYWLYWAEHGFSGADAIAVHEYWGWEGFTIWNALRDRLVHEWLNSHGFSHPPFLITECGRDAVEGGSAGWKISGISAVDYVAELLDYDVRISQDGYVLGATPFTGGPTPDWVNFDTDELTAMILGVPLPLLIGLSVDRGVVGIGDNVTAAASANGGSPPYSYRFDFGDGTVIDTGSGQQGHAYGALGNYTVTATVLDSAGAQASASAGVSVVENPPPPPGGNGLLIFGVLVATGVGLGLVMARRSGVSAELAVNVPGRPPYRQPLFGEVAVTDVRQIEEGEAIPPGYVRIE